MNENIEMCHNKMKVSRDPMSHRIIEKRRRDRMNSCLADLSRLIPATYLKKGRGRIEKTEIIELAIKHLKQLQAILYNRKLEHTLDAEVNQKSFVNKEQFYLGYQECLHETTCYLVENEGLLLGDPLCVRLLNHLNQHGKNISNKNNLHNRETTFFRGNSGIQNLESNCNSLGSFGDVENEDSQHFGLKKSPPRYTSSSPVINVDSAVYDCAEACIVQQGQPLVLNANNVAKMETFRWQGMELDETQPLKSLIVETEGDVGNIGGMSTCSRSSTIRSDEVFKYKTNIKERFNADQKVSKSDSDADETDDFTSSEEQIRRKKRSAGTSLQTVPNKRKISSSEEIGTGRDNVMIDNSRDLTEFSNKMRVPAIPIFALHPKGSYYVPMTVDSAIVLPQLNALNHFPSAMHHIEISVSFASEFVGANPLITRTK